MILATKNVLSLSPSKAKEFFLKEEMYSNITLPTYFSFQKLLDKLDKRLQNKNLRNFFTANDKPYNYDDVNYIIYNNKRSIIEYCSKFLKSFYIPVAITKMVKVPMKFKIKIKLQRVVIFEVPRIFI